MWTKYKHLCIEVLQGVVPDPIGIFSCIALQHFSELWHFIKKAMHLITHTHTHTTHGVAMTNTRVYPHLQLLLIGILRGALRKHPC